MESVKNDEDQAGIPCMRNFTSCTQKMFVRFSVLALATKYMSSPICKDVLADIEARGKPVSPTDDMAFQRRQSAGYATSFPYQVAVTSSASVLFKTCLLDLVV